VFWNAIDPEPHYQAYGCICLKETCTNAWPLVGSDAEDFYGDAACTPLSRSETGWGWH